MNSLGKTIVFTCYFLVAILLHSSSLKAQTCLDCDTITEDDDQFDSSSLRTETGLKCGTITEDDQFTVRSVKILGRWIPRDLRARVEKTVGVGELFSPQRASDGKSEIYRVLKEEDTRELTQGAFAVSFVTADICPLDGKQEVEITFRPYFVRVDLLNIGKNILPIPRINTPTFSAGVPPALLKTAPGVGVFSDRNYGLSLGVETSTDLLRLSNTEQNSADALNVNLAARHSLNESFYEVDTSLDYQRSSITTAINPHVSLRYSNQFSPLGEGENWREELQIQGGIQGNNRQSFVRNYIVGGVFSLADTSYTPRQSDSVQNSATELRLYAVGDSRIGNGFARLGAYFDAGFPTETENYQRVATQGGYWTDIPIGKDQHNAIGIQILGGTGYIWGEAPEYSQYFGGSLANNFLYATLNSSETTNFPRGPLLRSFGEQQAGIRGADGLVTGGNFYWHLNFNIAFPIRGWSQPLIPNIVVRESSKGPKKIGDLIKTEALVNSPRILKRQLRSEGYSEEAARELVENLFANEIEPTINYLVDRANLFSVKPLLLFDIGQISGSDNSGSTFWAAAGGGIQVNIVTGRLEAGYMQTVTPASDTGVGNFFLRLVFQDFF